MQEKYNISLYELTRTANTPESIALQRATFLKSVGSQVVLELCVGPSLPVLAAAYSRFGISCIGNDIDPRYSKALSTKRRDNFGKYESYIIGDARSIPIPGEVDTVVVAPPLSQGCSGRRSDSLTISRVSPSYYDFCPRLLSSQSYHVVMVLPGRSMATREDRTQLYKLLNYVATFNREFELVPLTNKVVKYYDLHIYKERYG